MKGMRCHSLYQIISAAKYRIISLEMINSGLLAHLLFLILEGRCNECKDLLCTQRHMSILDDGS